MYGFPRFLNNKQEVRKVDEVQKWVIRLALDGEIERLFGAYNIVRVDSKSIDKVRRLNQYLRNDEPTPITVLKALQRY